MSDPENTDVIRQLNDAFRRSFIGGKVMVTRGILNLPAEVQTAIEGLVKTFDTFTDENDHYEEHDFGMIEVSGFKVYWKIDYYDKACVYGSEDPSDPNVTTRVLTILLSSEY